MRRTPIVLAATVFGTGAVVGFHARPATLAAATGATTATTNTSAGTSARTTTTGARTALGDAENTRYGIAQVRVTVSNGKITKIEAVQLQNGDPHSAAISSAAEPILQRSVLAKQTAAVDTVSGATYTSLSYEASLQSALDKLGFKAASTASTDVSQLQ